MKAKQSRAIPPVVELWVLRILVVLKSYREWLIPNGFPGSAWNLAEGLGFDELCFEDTIDPGVLVGKLKVQHAAAERRAARTRLPAALARNAGRIAELVGLDDTAQAILAFAVLLKHNTSLQEAVDLWGANSILKLYTLLGKVLDHPISRIRRALSPSSQLAQSGLVRVRDAGLYHSSDLLDVLSQDFAEGMLQEVADPVDLFREAIFQAPPPDLALEDFTHVRALLDVVLPLLREADRSRSQGVNILIYGRTGTGKTQLTRVLAAALGWQLFEVSSEDADGDPITGERRLRAWCTALNVVARRQSLLMFDEAEDVFAAGGDYFNPQSTAQRHKAWMNRALEGNPLPCLWLSNTIDTIDPAFIRRFDVVYELPIPPRAQRARLLNALCGDLIKPREINHLSGYDHAAPAVVARAAKVLRMIQPHIPDEQAARVMASLVNNTLTAQGYPPMAVDSPDGVREEFDPACVAAQVDLEQVATRMAEAPEARVCLYGPPGTGKSAFARWLARELDKPLLVRRVSDLISPYLGQSESNLAETFHQATRQDAILLLDEVDSFLYDRGTAQRSWEVTLVNEMLTQMDAYRGVFIAATNRMEHLDPAALRRFDLKLRFDYLSVEQAWTLLERLASALGLKPPAASLKGRLGHLTNLTPGDFAVVRRQARFRPVRTTETLVVALAAECEAKPLAPRRSIGFI